MTYIVVSRSPPDYFGESDQNLQSGLALAADIYIMGGRDEGDTGKQGTYKTFQKLYNFPQSAIDIYKALNKIEVDPQALEENETMKTKANKQYEARMYRIGYSQHSTEQAAKRALAKFRREYIDAQAPMPYPWQTVEKDGVVIYTA